MKQQTARVVISMAAVLAVSIGFAWLIDAWVEGSSSLASAEVRLSELRARRLTAGDVEALNQTLSAKPDGQSGLLAASEKEAAPRLEAIIRSIAQGHRAELLSLSLADGKAGNSLPVVRGNMHLVISDDSIGSFLKSLEAGPPAVFLDRVQITSRSDHDDGEPLMLDLQTSLTVYRDVPANERNLP